MYEFLKNADPHFLALAGLTLFGVFYTAGVSIYESIHFHREFKKYASQLPEGEYIPTKSLCSILDMTEERLKEITGKSKIQRYEAENIIKEMISKEWW